MTVNFGTTVTGIRKFIVAMGDRADKIKNPRGANLAAVVKLEGWVKKNIKAEGKLHEERKYSWPPLSHVTIAKRRKGQGQGNPKMLQDTGRLLNGWTKTANNNYGQLRSQVRYSSTHEKGERRGSVVIPQRKIFPTVDQGRSIVLPVYQDWIRKEVL